MSDQIREKSSCRSTRPRSIRGKLSLTNHPGGVSPRRRRRMGNVERCDKTLPVNEMMFHVRRDAALRARFVDDLEALAREFGLSRAEYEGLRDKEPRRMTDLGGQQYYGPHTLRPVCGPPR